MSLFDRIVYLGCNAEVIRCDDKRPQLAILRRSFRKWKNSTPSRSRRFII